MGPRAVQLFEELGITVVIGVSGSLAEAVQALLQGGLTGGQSCCTHGDTACAPSAGHCPH